MVGVGTNPRILFSIKLILGSKGSLMNSIDIFGVLKGKSLVTKKNVVINALFSFWKVGMFSHNFLLTVFNSFTWTFGFIANLPFTPTKKKFLKSDQTTKHNDYQTSLLS